MKRFLFFAIVSFVLCACNKGESDFVQSEIEDKEIFYTSLEMGEDRKFILPPTGGKVGFTITSEYDMECTNDGADIIESCEEKGGNGDTREFIITVSNYAVLRLFLPFLMKIMQK